MKKALLCLLIALPCFGLSGCRQQKSEKSKDQAVPSSLEQTETKPTPVFKDDFEKGSSTEWKKTGNDDPIDPVDMDSGDFEE